MTDRHTISVDTERDRSRLVAWCARVPLGWVVEFREKKRTLDQNKKLWAMLDDLSKQVDWYGHKLEDYEWKDVMTAGLKKQKAVPGIEGGFVVLGHSTSAMTKAEFSDLIELMLKFGAEHGVVWSDE